jgi:hypothetical protein
MRKKHLMISYFILSIFFLSKLEALKFKSKNIILADTVPGFINDFLLSKNSKFGVDKKGDKHKLIELDVSQFTPPERNTDFTVRPDYPGMDGQPSPLQDFVRALPFVSSEAVYSFTLDNPDLPTGSRVKVSIEAPGTKPITKKLSADQGREEGEMITVTRKETLAGEDSNIIPKDNNFLNSSVSGVSSTKPETLSVQSGAVTNVLFNSGGSSNAIRTTDANGSGHPHVESQAETHTNSANLSSTSSSSGSTSISNTAGSVDGQLGTSSNTGTTYSTSNQVVIENGILTTNNSITRSNDILKPVSNSDNKTEVQKNLETIQTGNSSQSHIAGTTGANSGNNPLENKLNSSTGVAINSSSGLSTSQTNILNPIINSHNPTASSQDKIIKEDESLALFNPMVTRFSSQNLETVKVDTSGSELAPIKTNTASSGAVIIASLPDTTKNTNSNQDTIAVNTDSIKVSAVNPNTKTNTNTNISPSVTTTTRSSSSAPIIKLESKNSEEEDEFRRLPARTSISDNNDRNKNITLNDLNKTINSLNNTITVNNNPANYLELSMATFFIILTLIV